MDLNEDISFEYDSNKSKINKLKHGIDFEEAKELLSCENALIARVNSKCYVAFYFKR